MDVTQGFYKDSENINSLVVVAKLLNNCHGVRDKKIDCLPNLEAKQY